MLLAVLSIPSALRMAYSAGPLLKKVLVDAALVVTAVKAAAVAPSATPPTTPPTLFTVAALVAAALASNPPMTLTMLKAVVRLAAAVVSPATALLAITAPSSTAVLRPDMSRLTVLGDIITRVR
jgi:hypothetical protein